jgi:HPt (histidine-containing phosphotransfer) domain-containing protein
MEDSSIEVSASGRLAAEIGLEGALEMFELFEKDILGAIADIVRKHDSGNAGDVARCAHSLIGSFGMVGAHEFVDVARTLEASALAGDTNACARLVKALPGEVERLLPMVRSAIAGMKARLESQKT